MNQIRVLLVDTNDTLLEVVSELLVSEPDVKVVGVAREGADALQLVAALYPDLVLMDATLPGMSGFETARRIKKDPQAPVVALMSLHDSVAARIEASAAGADCYIAGTDVVGQLTPLVRQLRDLASGERAAPIESMKDPGDPGSTIPTPSPIQPDSSKKD